MTSVASTRYMQFAAGYGFVRGLVKTHRAKVHEYDEDLKKYKRPLMTVERAAAVAFSTCVGIACAPLMMMKDIYDIEHGLRGYSRYRPDSSYSVLEMVMR